jgi:EAL domain-containing protein (putative c-di-GMP-specific phosphodiesterase class I)
MVNSPPFYSNIANCNDNDTIVEHDKIRHSVTEVLEQRTLQSVYQPIVNHSRRKVFALEALSRPIFQGSLMQPEAWFRTAMTLNLYLKADLLALSCAIQGFQFLPREFKSSKLFINSTPDSLKQDSFLYNLEYILESNNQDPHQIIIEITEQSSYEPLELKKAVTALHKLGLRVALDDIGQGSSTLRALTELEPDFIKVDRTLIFNIASSKPKQKLLSLLVSYMGSGDTIIAEGIEHVEDFKAVKNTGVNLSQGFFWSHPMPARECFIQIPAIEGD